MYSLICIEQAVGPASPGIQPAKVVGTDHVSPMSSFLWQYQISYDGLA